VSHGNVHEIQQRLLDHRLLPYRLEIGLLPLLGVISDYKARRNDKRATVVVVIEQERTVAYILGKEGVHTPGPVRHGFASIVHMARKEFGLESDDAARTRLEVPDDALLLRATRLVRAIGRDLKPLVDSYEMTTGQPVGEIYCAYLPATLTWISEPLAQMVGRSPMTMDCHEWLPTVNLQAAAGGPVFDQHWLGVLSLVAELPGPKPDRSPKDDDPYQGPWHVDCRLSTHLPSTKQIRRRFLNFAVGTTLAVAAVMFTLWQLYVIRSLGADTAFWDQQMASNQKLFDELNQGTRTLSAGVTRLDFARDLMTAPYPVSDLILNLGRSLPPHLRVDRIETNAVGLTLSGGLSEPSEQASRTLDRYVDELQHSPAIGPYFAGISLTSLQRENDSDTLAFEITFRLKLAQP
jgi:Tfp pilus assembly protein PilN